MARTSAILLLPTRLVCRRSSAWSPARHHERRSADQGDFRVGATHILRRVVSHLPPVFSVHASGSCLLHRGIQRGDMTGISAQWRSWTKRKDMCVSWVEVYCCAVGHHLVYTIKRRPCTIARGPSSALRNYLSSRDTHVVHDARRNSRMYTSTHYNHATQCTPNSHNNDCRALQAQ